MLSEQLYLFHEGTNYDAYEFLGSHKVVKGLDHMGGEVLCAKGGSGYVFRTWAPHAKGVSVVGDFNNWINNETPMHKVSGGVWEVFLPGVLEFSRYKYAVNTVRGEVRLKADPFGVHMENTLQSATKVYDMQRFKWSDGGWIRKRKSKKYKALASPINIYEVHLGSWKKDVSGEPLSYAAMITELVPYVKDMGYTHVQFLPIMEHCDVETKGYDITGYFAPSSRFGTPSDFMSLVNAFHKESIGVILDVNIAFFPAHDPCLRDYDGRSLYEYADTTKRVHPTRDARFFDYGKREVKSFLISFFRYWACMYHIDGFMFSHMADMLYLDFEKEEGSWKPNKYGDNRNLEAIRLLQKINNVVESYDPSVLMIAGDHGSLPMVTVPFKSGGLSFGERWNTEFMADVLQYMCIDPFFRKGCHNKLTTHFTPLSLDHSLLPLSHNFAAQEKGSFITRMPGETDQQFANLKALYAYITAFPGKKLMFMGFEFAQLQVWDCQSSLAFDQLSDPMHSMVKTFVKDLNHYYLSHAQFFSDDILNKTFKVIIDDDDLQNIVVFVRRDKAQKETLVVSNFSPVGRFNYRIGVGEATRFSPDFTTECKKYMGKDVSIKVSLPEEIPMHGFSHSISLNIPPMSTTFFVDESKIKN